jgi:hypothetical protein
MTQPLQRCPVPAQQVREGSECCGRRDGQCTGNGHKPVAITFYMSLMACPVRSSMPTLPGIPQ